MLGKYIESATINCNKLNSTSQLINVKQEYIETAKKELKKLRSSLYYRYCLRSIQHSISQDDLLKLMRFFESRLMIIDMRLESDYAASHIDFECISNFPADCCVCLEDFIKFDYLSEESKAIWKTHKNKSSFVLYSDDCKGFSEVPQGSLMRYMLEYLMKLETEPSFFVLSGGFQQWQKELPLTCTNYINPLQSSSISTVADKIASEVNNDDKLYEKKEKLMQELLEVENIISASEMKALEEAELLLANCLEVQDSQLKTNEKFWLEMNGYKKNNKSQVKKRKITD